MGIEPSFDIMAEHAQALYNDGDFRGAFELVFEKNFDELFSRWAYLLLQSYLKDTVNFYKEMSGL